MYDRQDGCPVRPGASGHFTTQAGVFLSLISVRHHVDPLESTMIPRVSLTRFSDRSPVYMVTDLPTRIRDNTLCPDFLPRPETPKTTMEQSPT